MAIEKGLSPAPMGIEEEIMEDGEMPEAALEIEIVNPDMVTLDDGSVEVTIIPGDDKESNEFTANIAEELDEDELSLLAEDIIEFIPPYLLKRL